MSTLPDSGDLEVKLSAARTRLILDKPFLGALVLRLPVVAADPEWCPTTATDARQFYYNPAYIDALNPAQTEFVLAHEALHCALSHFARRGHRVKARWDVACDYAVNPLLVDDGLEPPPNTLLEDSYRDMTAEEIYPYIQDNDAEEPMDRHAYDRDDPADGDPPPPEDGPAQSGQGEGDERGAPQPPPLSDPERDTLAVQWRQRLAGAAQQAMQAGKLGVEMARLVDHLLQPQLPWRMLLARYLSNVSRDDFSYMRPARREGDAILPRLRSAGVEVVVALDTSGSVSDEELAVFLSELDAIKGHLRARITVLACDAELRGGCPWVFEPWESCSVPEGICGGGGTRFTPVFDWVDAQDTQPDVLVYFTDAEGEFPDAEPACPVLWLVKGRGQVPWGERIQLN